MPLLKSMKGITLVITVQGVSEQPEEVQQLCTDNELKHFFIELEGANEALLAYKLADHVQTKKLRGSIQELITMLKDQDEVALIHCAAGIHRTGILAYTLLRLLGQLGKKEAYAKLAALR